MELPETICDGVREWRLGEKKLIPVVDGEKIVLAPWSTWETEIRGQTVRTAVSNHGPVEFIAIALRSAGKMAEADWERRWA